MKILVATKEKQGVRKNDFCFTNEGEIVRFGMECGGERIDGRCGCRRSLCGLDTSKATTTMKVIDTKMTQKKFESLYLEALKKDGWVIGEKSLNASKLWAKQGVEDILKITNEFKHGDIVEKRGDKFNIR